ncbi:hypothetical protein HPB52_023109 [Rhipicephalus sanguineus]|uniref:HTH psq-type domain-containing protein n=1 Tax=Rhipicephalus sanguineus TaxID=34632 RepID=A0A9D4PFK5_RHISA|nr:hypothetical protein HPB52_023109 [Rhipicephalus sanguineus]
MVYSVKRKAKDAFAQTACPVREDQVQFRDMLMEEAGGGGAGMTFGNYYSTGTTAMGVMRLGPNSEKPTCANNEHDMEAEKRNGATKASIARDLNIPESSLKTILTKKDSILLKAAKFGLNRKAAKDGKYAAMEKALVEWLCQARSSGIAVDGAILKEKAETVALRCSIDDFKASNAAAVPVDDEPEFANLELPGSFADYVGADDDVAVCSEVSLDDIIETVRPDTAGTSDEEEMDDAAEASASIPTYADVLCYVDHIRRFACARDEIGDLLPDFCVTATTRSTEAFSAGLTLEEHFTLEPPPMDSRFHHI